MRDFCSSPLLLLHFCPESGFPGPKSLRERKEIQGMGSAGGHLQMKRLVVLRPHDHLGAGPVMSIPILQMNKLRPETAYGQRWWCQSQVGCPLWPWYGCHHQGWDKMGANPLPPCVPCCLCDPSPGGLPFIPTVIGGTHPHSAIISLSGLTTVQRFKTFLKQSTSSSVHFKRKGKDCDVGLRALEVYNEGLLA